MMTDLGTRRALAHYAKAMETVPPLTAVIMLYDGTIKQLFAAAAAAELGDHERLFHCSQRAGQILTGLDAALDHDRSPAVAATLHRCYRIFIHCILALPRRPNAADEARHLGSLLRPIRDAWAQLEHTEPVRTSPPPGGFDRSV